MDVYANKKTKILIFAKYHMAKHIIEGILSHMKSRNTVHYITIEIETIKSSDWKVIPTEANFLSVSFIC